MSWAKFYTVLMICVAISLDCGHAQTTTSEPSPRPSGENLTEVNVGTANITSLEVQATNTNISINVSSTPSLQPSGANVYKPAVEASNVTSSPNANLSFASPIAQITPTPAPTVPGSWSSQSDDLLAVLSGSSSGSSLTVEAVIFFTFPNNSTAWDESQVEEVSTAVQNFLGNQANFSGVSVTVGVTPGDVYGVLSLDNTAEERTVAVTLTITVPWIEMGLIDEYTLQLLLEQSISDSKSVLVESLSNSFGYDFEANGVKVSFVVLLTPPTSAPTYAPTTAAAFNEIKKQRRIRSWIFISIFWVIVLMCFALENGLCACKSWRANENQYGAVNARHLD